MTYKFTAVRKNGERYNGQMEAVDKLGLARILRASGDILISVKEKKAGGFNINSITVSIKTTDLILFARNMAGLMQAGVSLARGVEILEKQTTNVKMKIVLRSIFETIKSGGNFSDALSKHPRVFDSLFVSMIRAGEESGNLVGTLKEVETHLKRSHDLKRKVKGATMYPMVILGAMGIIGLLMMKFVVPGLLKTFTDFKVELPFTTKVVVWISNTINNYFIWLFIAIIIFITGFIYYKNKCHN